jgi:thioredoxin family protein
MPGLGVGADSKRVSIVPNVIIWLATVSGLVLSVVSLLKICSSCSETAQYRVFGMDFGWFGVTYFVVLTIVIALQSRFAGFSWLASLLCFASAGAESHFIWIQKYEIGQWCPICLSLASAVFIACIGISWYTFQNYTAKGAAMKSKLVYIVLVTVFFVMGLGSSVVGVKKEADAAELDLFLGKASSPTTVYFVSDWFCPACRKAEPAIEKMYPELAKTVKIGFVDLPIHKETLNFTPYNLQFLSFEKAKYINLRKALAELSLKTKNPSEAEVQAAVTPLGVKLRQVNYADTLYGMQSNLTVYRGYGVNSTPSVVVTNSKTKKTKVLVGDVQISEQAVKAAITEVEKK